MLENSQDCIYYINMLGPYRMVVVNIAASLLLFGGVLIYRYLYPKKKINLFLLLIIVSILPVISIFRAGTYESGDLTIHTAFLINFYENLKDKVFIPQWAPLYCGGYGCPIFLFLYTLPYYIASLFHSLGFSFLDSIKLLLAGSFIVSGITMYFFAKDLWGEIAGFTASIFYLFSPYHLEDLHFRVSVGEVLSFSFTPLIFLFSKKIIEHDSPFYFILLSLSIGLSILAHSSTSAIIIPLSFLFSLIIWYKEKKKNKKILTLCASFITGLSLSAFYWAPSLLEVKYSWISQYVNMSNMSGDFKPFWEYIYSPVLFGFLFQGHNGELRLIIGYPHLFIICIALVYLFTKKVSQKTLDWTILILFLSIFFILFLLLQSFTKPIWNVVPILKTFQFVWRLLVPISFITSIIAAIVVKKINNNVVIIILCAFTMLSTILNWGNRKMIPEDTNSYSRQWSTYAEYYDEIKPLFVERYKKRVNLIPQLVLDWPKQPAEILSGIGLIKQLERTSINHSYLVKASTNLLVKENTYYFPGWKVFVDDSLHPFVFDNPNYAGLITFTIPKGLYKIDIRFTDTPVRKISRLISYLAIGVLIFFTGRLYFIKMKRR